MEIEISYGRSTSIIYSTSTRDVSRRSTIFFGHAFLENGKSHSTVVIIIIEYSHACIYIAGNFRYFRDWSNGHEICTPQKFATVGKGRLEKNCRECERARDRTHGIDLQPVECLRPSNAVLNWKSFCFCHFGDGHWSVCSIANGAWQVRSSRATKFRTTKINSGGRVLPFTKICTPENYPLYGSMQACSNNNKKDVRMTSNMR